MPRDDQYFATTAVSGKLRVWGIVLSRPWDVKHLIFHPEWAIDFWLLDRPLDQKVRTLADLRETLSRSFDRHLGRVVWIHGSLEKEVGRRWAEPAGSASGEMFAFARAERSFAGGRVHE